MKTTLLFSSITGLLFLPSCVCNTSGKLDTVGKTRHAFIVEHPQTLYVKNGEYYIKGESVTYNTQTATFMPLGSWWDGSGPDLSPRPNTKNRSIFYRPIVRTVNNPYGRTYRHKRELENELTSTSMLADYCKPKPGTQWIPAAEFEQTPCRELPIEETRSHPEQLVFLDLGDTHRSAGNILRTPIVATLAIAIDTPASLISIIGGSFYYLFNPSAFYHPKPSMQPAPGLRTLHPSAFAHGS